MIMTKSIDLHNTNNTQNKLIFVVYLLGVYVTFQRKIVNLGVNCGRGELGSFLFGEPRKEKKGKERVILGNF